MPSAYDFSNDGLNNRFKTANDSKIMAEKTGGMVTIRNAPSTTFNAIIIFLLLGAVQSGMVELPIARGTPGSRSE